MRSRAAVALVLAACGGGHSTNDGGSGGNSDGNAGNDSGGSACGADMIDVGAGCEPIDPNAPSQRSKADVCARWSADHVVTDSEPLTANGTDCDPGSLSTAGKADALKRLNGFRWLAGLGPTTESDALDTNEQACANLESWWDFSSGLDPHSPPDTSKCYTSTGASAAGASNVAWGSGLPAQAIDQWVQDNGNTGTMGHRRWIMNPPLGPIGIGYWQTGGTYGNAACLAVFGTSGTSATPDFVAVPNPGPVPVEITQWTWTFSSALGGTASATVAMTRLSDHADLDVTQFSLTQGYGQDAIAWAPSGWTPTAGETYRVTISGLAGGDVVYAVKPIACN